MPVRPQQPNERPKKLDKSIWLTTGEFARRANCSKTSVQSALNTGKIKGILFGQWWRINVNTELAKMTGSMKRPRLVQRFKDGGYDGNGGRDPSVNTDEENDTDSINSMNAPLMERVYKAKRAKLEYLERKKELIPAETVSHEWQVIAQGLLAALLSIPDRVSPMIEGMGHREIHIVLTKEIKHACQQLSDSIRADK